MQNRQNKFYIYGLVIVVSSLMAACRPVQKVPPLDYDHNRIDAKVDAVKLDSDNPIAKIGIPELWKKTTGKFADGNRVRVAVVGTGVDYTIPDIRDALWVNLGEYSDKARNNGMDDDGNGYPDDIIGYDFFSGAALPYDWNGHDTFTASIIAATARSNPNVIGVAPNAEIIIARYIGPEGRGKGMDAVEALEYSIKNNAKVIYFNWPEGGFAPTETPLVLEALKDAGDHNILVVTPAGNSGNHSVPAFIQLAAKLPNVVVVAGLDKDGRIKSTSNSGKSLALTAAPSVGARGYFPGGVESEGLETTSVAAAYVTGAAALLATLPQMGSIQKIKAALLSSTEKKVADGKSPGGAGQSLDVLSNGSIHLGGL